MPHDEKAIAAQTAELQSANGSGPRNTFSLNVAGSIYEKTPANLNVGRFRNFQVASQLDVKVGPMQWEKPPVFSLAGYY